MCRVEWGFVIRDTSDNSVDSKRRPYITSEARPAIPTAKYRESCKMEQWKTPLSFSIYFSLFSIYIKGRAKWTSTEKNVGRKRREDLSLKRFASAGGLLLWDKEARGTIARAESSAGSCSWSTNTAACGKVHDLHDKETQNKGEDVSNVKTSSKRCNIDRVLHLIH